MLRRAVVLAAVLCAALAMFGCGTTERSGSVGETLQAEGLQVTVQRVDTDVPAPTSDVTGLSRAAPGFQLVGTLVRVCSDNGAAVGPYDFALSVAGGGSWRLKFPQLNYAASFESQREGCGGGWVVFEIPSGSRAEQVRFGFEDTGTSRRPQDAFKVRFSWAISA